MSKISNVSSYSNQSPVEGEDYVIGTAANSTPVELETKTFTMSGISQYVISNIVPISDYVNLTTNQTVGGIKTFSSDLRLNGGKKLTFSNDVDGFNSIQSDESNIYGYGTSSMIVRSGGIGVVILDGDGDTLGDIKLNDVNATGMVTGSGFSATSILEYADNAAALVGGLSVGAFYRTGDLLKVVH